MAVRFYWNKSWHTLEGRERNTTSQCFLIAIDLPSCSLWRTSLTVCVCVRACVCTCSRVCVIILVCFHVRMCMCVYSMCISVYVCSPAIFWQSWHGAPLWVKADTQCYSSLVFHSFHPGSECLAPISLFCLFTSTPPLLTLFPPLSHSNWPPLCNLCSTFKANSLDWLFVGLAC